MERLINPKSYNLSTWLIAPLVGLTVWSKIELLVNCYLDESLSKFIVVNDIEFKNTDLYERWINHKNYFTDFENDKHIVFVFRISDVVLDDVRLITESKYSKINETTKKLIYSLSGLTYNTYHIDENRNKITEEEAQRRKRAGIKTPFVKDMDEILHALENSQNYRMLKERELGMEIPEDIELYEAFNKEKEIINIENVLKTQNIQNVG